MDPVLVLGGCGALGYHIIKQLLDTKAAADVTSLDIGTSGSVLMERRRKI
jgi:sterol-4alpha-carboxylate 3-dehydrogenase (decarboxylating)